MSVKTIKKKVHFLGIGGIGVSALAQYYLAKGHKVSGSDLVASEITDFLKKKGVKITIGENFIHKDADLVIYSPAVKIKEMCDSGTQKSRKIQSYPEALGELTKEYFTIAITGTHGKSTTTAMTALILIEAGLNPTVIVGTKLKEFGNSNFKIGNSKYLVIEACEYEESFLNYHPDIIVITNIEADHLDYFKNFTHIQKAFIRFSEKLKEGGFLIAKYKNKTDAKKLKGVLKIPGEHNVENALAALAVARSLKIPDKVSFGALSKFKGVWRRFEERKWGKVKIISDYGHHPTEIEATLRAAKEKYPNEKIWCIFQPHQYQRTYCLLNDFIRVFSRKIIDRVIITDIYDVAGRENKQVCFSAKNKKTKRLIDSEKLVKKISKKNLIYMPKDKLLNFIRDNISGYDVLIIMGAGDIYELDKKIK